MAINTIKYFVKEGFKNIWINGMMSVASILVMLCCMLLTGVAVLLSFNISETLKSIGKQNSITIYLKVDIGSAKASKVGEEINKIPNVLSCEYYPREEAVKKYKEFLGDFFDVLQGDENPLPDAYHVTMEDLAQYDQTVSDIKSVQGVDSVSDRSDTAKRLTSVNKFLSDAGFCIVILLGGVSLFIISNTIKLTMYSRRFEINIMKSVGATNWFIRIPFIIEGIIIGFISALLSTILLKLTYDEMVSLINNIIPFRGIPFGDMFWPIFISFSISGMIFGLLGGLISISRYLKKEGGDVVAW